MILSAPIEEPVKLTEREFEAFRERLEDNALTEGDRTLILRVFKAMLWMTAQLEAGRLGMARLKKLIFGEKSERKDKLFPSKEPPKPNTPEGQRDKISGHGRNPISAFTGANKVFCPHATLKVGDACIECVKGKLHSSIENGIFLRLIGNPLITATVYETEKLRCGLCGRVYEASLPKGVPAVKWDETACSIAALSRFGYGIPHYRSEKMQGDFGIPISDSVFSALAANVARCADPIEHRLVELGAQGRLVHSDDTSMRILELMKENKTRDPKKERVGIFTTAMIAYVDDKEIALFFTGRNHTGENITKLFKKRAGDLAPPFLTVDGASRNIPKKLEAILIACLTHGRRQFVGLEEDFPEEIKYVIELLADVYQYDAEAKDLKLTDEERLRYHQKKSAPRIEELKSWCRNQIESKKTEPNSGLGRAINYMEKRWEELTVFLRMPGAPLSNDIVERLIKRCVLHRKNSLFYKTQEGARVGDILMTVIHTATRANVNPFDYLTEIQRHAEEVKQNPDAWLPWNYLSTLFGAKQNAPVPHQ